MGVYEFLKLLKKHAKQLGITGAGVRSDGELVVFVEDESRMNNISLLASEHNVRVSTQVGKFQLMSQSDEFFRNWCGGNCLCSPPVGGITCHHCASPYQNKSNAGSVGNLYDYERQKVGTTKIIEDRSFRERSWIGAIASVLCNAGLNFCAYSSYTNKYDFAYVDYQPFEGSDPVVGVIFAGIDKGPYAVAYNIANVEKFNPNVPTDSLSNYMDKRVYAHVMHCMKKYCPVIKREYVVKMNGFVNVYAYGNVYTFIDVYFLRAVDTPLTVSYKDEQEVVYWSVQPGYSGGVVRAYQ